MLKSSLKGMVWKLADSEHNLTRRFGWRLLALFRHFTDKPATTASSHDDNDSISIRDHDLFYLKQLYQRCNRNGSKSAKVSYRAGLVEADDARPELVRKAGKLVVIAPSLPKYDRSSSGLRVAQLVKTWVRFVDSLTFVYTAKSEFDPHFKRFLPDTVQYLHVPETSDEIAKCVVSLNPNVLILTDLFDRDFLALCSEVLDKIKEKQPLCKVVLDTMDCHWKKYVRKALLSDSSVDWRNGLKYWRVEQEIYPKADLLTVVTEAEGDDIELSINGTPGYWVLPNCYELGQLLPTFDATGGLCFVGAASVNHNLDAMRYFRDEIYDLLTELVPGFTISVFGTGWDAFRSEFVGYPFKFLGQISDLDGALSHSRVFICPLLYGAGMKGKLGSAASAGIPVVTTSIGSEGYPVRNKQDYIVADEPAEFALACARLLTDGEVWEETRDNLRSMMDSCFGRGSMQVAVSRLIESLRAVGSEPSNH